MDRVKTQQNQSGAVESKAVAEFGGRGKVDFADGDPEMHV
jgi:hypothetical protein